MISKETWNLIELSRDLCSFHNKSDLQNFLKLNWLIYVKLPTSKRRRRKYTFHNPLLLLTEASEQEWQQAILTSHELERRTKRMLMMYWQEQKRSLTLRVEKITSCSREEKTRLSWLSTWMPISRNTIFKMKYLSYDAPLLLHNLRVVIFLDFYNNVQDTPKVWNLVFKDSSSKWKNSV